MDNVIRVQRFPELDQRGLIYEESLKTIPDLQWIVSFLSFYIERVNSENTDEEVILGTVFTNVESKRSTAGRHFLTLMVYPVYPYSVDYVIKKEDFYVNQGKDPIHIKGIWHEQEHERPGSPHSHISDYLLFKKDPFLNKGYYNPVLEKLLEEPRKQHKRLSARCFYHL